MKKLISLFVMCCLLLCLVPGLAFASDETGTEPTPNSVASVTAPDDTVTYYEKFSEAVDAAEAKPGSIIKLLDKIDLDHLSFTSDSALDVTLDLNGHVITLYSTDYAITLGYGKLRITDSSQGKTGQIIASNGTAFNIPSGAELTLENVNVRAKNCMRWDYGTIIFTGHFRCSPSSTFFHSDSFKNGLADSITFPEGAYYNRSFESPDFKKIPAPDTDELQELLYGSYTEIIPADFVKVSPNTDGTHSLKCNCGCDTELKTENCNFAYTAAANVITAKCQTEGCGAEYTLTLRAPEAEDLVYDGNPKEVTVENHIPGLFPDGEQLVVTYTGDTTNVTEDGFSASLTVGMESNTATAELTGIKIQPAELDASMFTLSQSSFEYNAEVQNPTVSSALSENDYTMGEIPQSVDAGTYTIPVTGKGNYTGEAKLQYLINPKPITITAEAQTIDYGSDYNKTAIKPVDGLVTGHEVASVTVKANGNELIPSDATIKDAEGKDVTANYSITYENGTLTFTPAETEITVKKELVSIDEDHVRLDLDISLKSVENGAAPSGEIKVECAENFSNNPYAAHANLTEGKASLSIPSLGTGFYKLSISYYGDDNYSQAYYDSEDEDIEVAGNKIVLLEISDVFPAPAGEPLELHCNNVDNSKVTYEVVSGDATINGSTLTADNPGKVTIKAYKAEDDTSYAEESKAKEINITPPLAKLDPKAPDGENGWYKEARLVAPSDYTISTTEDGNYSDSISFPEGPTTELTYYLKDSAGALISYTFPGPVNVDGTAPVISCTSGDITENSAIITASATDSGSGLASSSLSYVSGGSIEPTIENVGDKYNISGMEPGTGYIFIFTAKDNAGNTAEQNISVVTRPVIPSGLSGVYGEFISSVTLPEGWSWATYGKMELGEQKYAATHNSGAHPYLVPVKVLPRALTVTVDAADRAYDGTKNVSLTGGTLNNVYGSDDVSLDLSNAVAQMADANVGTDKAVTITKLELTGAAKDNYTLTIPTDVKVNISAKSVTPTVSLSTDSFTYSGKEHRPTVSLKDGASTIDPANYTVTYSHNVKVGQATATIEPKAGGNYVFDNQIKTFTINKAELSIGPRPLRVYRGSAVPTLEMVISGLISGDTVSLDPAPLFRIYDRSGNEVTAAQAVKTVGSYTIRWVNAENSSLSGQDSGNYYADFRTEARLTVLAPPVTNSGSSGSGGGYYAPAPAATSTPGISVSISGDDKTIYASARISGSTATVDKVDLTKLDTVIGSQVKTGTVTVDFSRNTAGKNINTVEIPADAVKKIANAVADSNNDADALEIVLSKGRSIEFDGVALAEKVRQAGGEDITISIEHADTVDSLTPEQKKAIGYRDAYEINVWSGGRHISDMGGMIHVHVPYQLRAGEDAAGLRVYYVDEKGQLELCESSYDSSSQHIRFVTDHLSLYMIDYEAPAATEPEETPAVTAPVSTEAPAAEQLPEAEENGFSGLFLWLILLLVAVVGLGLAAWLLIRKKLK